MRITTPRTDRAMKLDTIDLSTPALYTRGDPHQAWHVLRAVRPVFWNDRPGGRGFWVVTRHRDVRRVLRDYDTFTSETGTALDMIGIPDLSAGKMMHATDPPCHQRIRTPLERPLTADAVSRHAPVVRALVQRALTPPSVGSAWDIAAAATRLPVALMVQLMRLPGSDLEFLLHAAYASVAPDDPHYRTGSAGQTTRWAHSALVDYFTKCVRARRADAGDDLLSHLVTMDVAGHVLTDEEAVFNCFSLLVGGVVTTSQVVSATVMTAAERPDGTLPWPAGVDTAQFVDEALRWSSPTTHFMRYARRDVVLHDVQIRKGEPVTAWIASANRDEEVFSQPYSFQPDRRPNRHVTFGTGAHRCIGRQLARVTLRAAFALLRNVGRFELAGEPHHLASNLIAGLVRLPVKVTPR